MRKIAHFEKVSETQFSADWTHTLDTIPLSTTYEQLLLPKRATRGSAGYDFFAPMDFTLAPGETIQIPTGMRVRIKEGWVLLLFPRSSLGFRYRLQMDNTVGVIDSDYCHADNEGHIFIKMTNDSHTGRSLTIAAGEAFAQGVFMPFGITDDDAVENERHGGLGSTN